MAPTIGRVALDNGFHGSIPGDWVAPPPQNIQLAYKESTGIPRRVNRICEKSLMYASQQGKRLIDEHLVRYIIEHEMLGGDTHQ